MIRRDVAPRPQWRQRVSEAGCPWHDEDGDAGWDESHAYVLTGGEVARVREAARELAGMVRRAVAHVVTTGGWSRVGISEAHAPLLAASWHRGEFSLCGRFDLLLDASGQPRLIEFNADNALTLVETAMVQREWQSEVCAGASQWNDLRRALVEAWRASGASRVHCVWRPRHAEIEGTVRWMAGVIREAGLEAVLTALHCIGWDPKRSCFIDRDGVPVECCWKLYPWLWMLGEPFARHVEASGCRFVEPAWRHVAGSKGLLAVLCELFPGHPALLPCGLGPPPGDSLRVVQKPIFGREGHNITVSERGRILAQTGGECGAQAMVWQEWCEAPRYSGKLAQLGVWVVGDEPVALGIRETQGRILTSHGTFVPHVIE